MKVREELGYDEHNPYKDEADEEELRAMKDIEREMKIAERIEQAQIAEHKFKRQGETFLAR